MVKIFALGMLGIAGITIGSLNANKGWAYKYIGMPAMTFIDPEKAHKLAIWFASRGLVPLDSSTDSPLLVCVCYY